MGKVKRNCFVIMPFLPELHYLYLYLKLHVEQHYNMECERADAQVLTKPILDKINDRIRDADVIIADCSGRNPNVFYELGIAHAHGKQVILLTKDPVQEAPSDIRHYEFIYYELDKHVHFLQRINNALRNVFAERYESLYECALTVFDQFRQATGDRIDLATKAIFLDRVMAAERTRLIPAMDDDLAFSEFVLPRIIADSADMATMSQITAWLAGKWKAVS